MNANIVQVSSLDGHLIINEMNVNIGYVCSFLGRVLFFGCLHYNWDERENWISRLFGG
jgi:hypothetical protein